MRTGAENERKAPETRTLDRALRPPSPSALLLLVCREGVAGRLASGSPVQGKCFPIDLCVSDSNGGIYPVAEHLIKI